MVVLHPNRRRDSDGVLNIWISESTQNAMMSMSRIEFVASLLRQYFYRFLKSKVFRYKDSWRSKASCTRLSMQCKWICYDFLHAVSASADGYLEKTPPIAFFITLEDTWLICSWERTSWFSVETYYLHALVIQHYLGTTTYGST